MVSVLPIKFVREDDKEHFPEGVLKLASLSQHNLPVAEGLAIAAPVREVSQILERLEVTDPVSFEVNKSKTSQLIGQIEIPEQLTREYRVKGISVSEVWRNFLKIWFRQLESHILREGVSGKNFGLSGQIVIFAKDLKAFGRAYVDLKTKEVLVKMDKGSLEFEEGIELDQVIVLAQRKLHLSYIFGFIVERGRVKLVKVAPFTDEQSSLSDRAQFESGENGETQTISKAFLRIGNAEKKTYLKIRAIKVYLELGEGFVTANDVDGFIVGYTEDEDREKKLFKFSELASSHNPLPVLYKFSANNLKVDAEVFLFARNKKRLFNTQVVLTGVSNEEILQMKRDLAAFGIFRKGTLKFWLELSSPKSLLSLEDYLSSGVDGVILDLGKLLGYLSGEEEISNPDLKERNLLIKFLEEPLKILQKAQVPLLVSGSVVLEDDILHFLIKMGIFGVILKSEGLDLAKENLKIKELSHPNLAASD